MAPVPKPVPAVNRACGPAQVPSGDPWPQVRWTYIPAGIICSWVEQSQAPSPPPQQAAHSNVGLGPTLLLHWTWWAVGLQMGSSTGVVGGHRAAHSIPPTALGSTTQRVTACLEGKLDMRIETWSCPCIPTKGGAGNIVALPTPATAGTRVAPLTLGRCSYDLKVLALLVGAPRDPGHPCWD